MLLGKIGENFWTPAVNKSFCSGEANTCLFIFLFHLQQLFPNNPDKSPGFPVIALEEIPQV